MAQKNTQLSTQGRRAKIIEAQGERQAADQFLEAGRILSRQGEAMQLRYLTTLRDIAGERSSTIVFPLPIDLAKGLGAALGRKAGDGPDGDG